MSIIPSMFKVPNKMVWGATTCFVPNTLLYSLTTCCFLFVPDAMVLSLSVDVPNCLAAICFSLTFHTVNTFSLVGHKH